MTLGSSGAGSSVVGKVTYPTFFFCRGSSDPIRSLVYLARGARAPICPLGDTIRLWLERNACVVLLFGLGWTDCSIGYCSADNLDVLLFVLDWTNC